MQIKLLINTYFPNFIWSGHLQDKLYFSKVASLLLWLKVNHLVLRKPHDPNIQYYINLRRL